MKKGSLSHLAQPGATLAVRVTPKAAQNRVKEVGNGLSVHVTAPPENGKANRAVVKLIAHALGVPKSRLALIRGASSRDKLFRLDQALDPLTPHSQSSGSVSSKGA